MQKFKTASTAIQEFVGILKRLTNFMTWLLLALAVMFVIYAAYLYLTSQGDAEKVKQASKVILYAAVSIGVALLAYVFVSVVTVIVKPSSQRAPSTEFLVPEQRQPLRPDFGCDPKELNC